MPVDKKVAYGGLAGALTVVLVWGASLFGVDVPPGVASAVTTILSFAVGWAVPRGA